MRSISGSSGRFSGASMTKQSTPSAGIGQLPTIAQLESRRELLGNPLPAGAAGLRRIAADDSRHRDESGAAAGEASPALRGSPLWRRPSGRSPRLRAAKAKRAQAPRPAARAARPRGCVIAPPARPEARRSAPSARRAASARPRPTAPPAPPARTRGWSSDHRRSGRRRP